MAAPRLAKDFINVKAGPGGFHYHTTFRPDPRFADEITEMLAQGGEYTTLKLFAGSADSVHHPYLGIYTAETLQRIRAGLRSEEIIGDKFAGFALREPYATYGDTGRLGFELRGLTSVDDAKVAVTNMVRFLESPDTALVKFGTQGKPYRMADVVGVDRLSSKTVNRFSRTTQEFLRKAAGNAHPDKRTQASTGALEERWALPLVKWELRGHIPTDAKPAINKARAKFLQQIDALAASYHGKPVGAEAQQLIEELVSKWARDTALWRYF